MVMAEHTKTPWRLVGKSVIRDEEGWIATVERRNRDANAAFIVRAANCHAELVALAEQFEQTIQFYMRKDAADGDDEGARMNGGTLRDVRELLAKASGVKP
jgi:hypothetical protein